MSSSRTNFSSGAKWEVLVGYSRAVRMGNMIEISGTVAMDENNNTIGEGDAYLQTAYIIKKIETALLQAGSSLEDVVRTRMYVTDISRWEEYGRAHGEAFAAVMPCTTMVEVTRLIAPQYLIEIEATAITDKQKTIRQII